MLRTSFQLPMCDSGTQRVWKLRWALASRTGFPALGDFSETLRVMLEDFQV